jgi:hypothetical protein
MGGQNLADWTPLAFKAQAPTGAVRMTFAFRKWGTTPGQTDSWAWFARPQVVETTATAAAGVAYSPSNDRAIVETQQTSINGIFAKWGVELDVNGYVTGIVLNNNGSRGDMTVRVDKFSVGFPGTGASYPFELVGSTTYIRNAVIQNAAIDTLKVAGNAITANQVITSGDVGFSGVITNFIETGWMTIGDGVSGNAMITLSCSMDAAVSGSADASARVYLFVDTGGGWVQVRSQLFGVASGGGDTRWRMTCALVHVVAGGAVRVLGQCIANNEIFGSVVRAMAVRDIVVSLVGTKR